MQDANDWSEGDEYIERETLGEIGVGYYGRWHRFKTQVLEGGEILIVTFLGIE